MDSRQIGPDGAQPLFQVSITSEARAPLQALLERCADFVELTEQRAVRASEADEVLTVLPPGYSLDDKLVVGLYTGPDQLVGVFDLLRGYPGPGDWWIALLVLDPAWRGRGLGERAVADLHDWFRGQGAAASWLCVVDQNPAGFRFWQRVGYETVDRRVQRLDGGLENQVWRMRCRL